MSTPELLWQTLPDLPGVYQFYDAHDRLLYVGKAKNLKKRVSSYFSKQHDTAKTRVLVQKIHRVAHIVVQNETEALLLENNLIKQNQPPYNIRLKDDKTYPWICIRKEPYPRVFTTRRLIRDGSEYFGPYTNFKVVNTLLELIRNLYPLRSCTLDLSAAAIDKGKYKVCLEYHIGNCKGPCEGYEPETEYLIQVEAIRQLLKGNFNESLRQFKADMKALAADMRFEEAQQIKDKIEALEAYQARSTVASPNLTQLEVYGIISDEQAAYVNFLQIEQGAIVKAHTLEVRKKMDETEAEILAMAIVELRQRFGLRGREVLVPFPVDLGNYVRITVPRQGEKKQLIDLSIRNARAYRIEQLKQLQLVNPEQHTDRLMTQMKADLRLPVLPIHIECFDNSNIQGTSPVAACVVFKNGKPSKKDYRHFHVKTVEGPNDFASMEEIVYRRYKRLLDENQPLPQLILIDGGKGQLGAALKSLEQLDLRGKISVIGIAKRLEELYYPGDSVPLYLDKRSETLKVIQYLRNEAHRFGLQFHRDTRSKGALQTSLQDIPGIGEKTYQSLMQHFKSSKRLGQATLEEIAEQVGMAKAKKIVEFYQNKPTS